MKYTTQTSLFRKTIVASMTIVVLGFFFGACSPQKPTPPPMYIHTVSVQGETLGLISDWYTGSAQNWRAIAAQNPGLNPNRLRMGDQVFIPESMTRRTDPLTKKYVESATKRGVGGDTFAKANTTAPASDSSATAGTTSGNTEAPPSVSDTTTTQPIQDANAAAVKAAESETATANQAAAKVVEAAKDANTAGSTEEAAAKAEEAVKQAQAAAEEAAQKANAAAADAAAKAAEATKDAQAQAAQASDAANVAAANAAAVPPAADKPKTKEELLKELLEDK